MQLSEVLRLFDSPLSQEQCWSIAYGVCRTLVKKKHEDYQRKERIRYILSLDSLILTQRGEIEILYSEPNLHEIQKESELIFATGNLICRCLDFGLDEEEICEVRFQDDLAELIGGMVLQHSEFDEGIGDTDSLGESWESRKFNSTQHRSFKTLVEVLRFCDARLLRKNIEVKDRHYVSITRALYLEVSELKAFLGHVLHDLDEEKTVLEQQAINRPELAKRYVKEWAKLWIRVMEELRQKTKEMLKQNDVLAKPLVPETEYYHCTPFDIASLGNTENLPTTGKTYDAKIEIVSDGLPVNAEHRIFDFLRSRASSQEDLITTDHVRTMSPDSLDNNLDDGKENTDVLKSMKKTLQIHSGLVRKISDWDKYRLDNTLEQDFLDGSYVSDDDETGDVVNPFPGNRQKSSSVNQIKDNNYDVFSDSLSSLRRNTVAVIPVNTSKQSRFSKSELCLHQIDINEAETDELNKIGASLTEIFKIRQELTRAELEFTRDLEVKNSKKCFGCRKNKFTFFQRARLCAVCKRKYCLNCIKENVAVPPSLTESLPPNIDITHNANQNSSLVRSKSMFDVGPSTTVKQLPWQRNAKVNGVRLNMCCECHIFVDSIQSERKKLEWKVKLELDL